MARSGAGREVGFAWNECDLFCFASIVLLEGILPPVPVRPERPGKPDAQPMGTIEIALGQV